MSNQIYPREMKGLDDSIEYQIKFHWCKNEFKFLVNKIEEELRGGTPFQKMLIMARSHWYLHLAVVLRTYNIPIRLNIYLYQKEKTAKKLSHY